eukprot:Pgem_evm1s17131
MVDLNSEDVSLEQLIQADNRNKRPSGRGRGGGRGGFDRHGFGSFRPTRGRG